MSEIVERLAQAMCCYPFGYCQRDNRTGVCEVSDRDREQARAWLAVIREPTEAMIDAAFNAAPIPSMRAVREHYRLALRAAIDAALGEAAANLSPTRE